MEFVRALVGRGFVGEEVVGIVEGERDEKGFGIGLKSVGAGLW